jgi:hypothetical protein
VDERLPVTIAGNAYPAGFSADAGMFCDPERLVAVLHRRQSCVPHRRRLRNYRDFASVWQEFNGANGVDPQRVPHSNSKGVPRLVAKKESGENGARRRNITNISR